MTTCDTCGNEYKNNFKLSIDNKTYNFDCFECAIAKVAPICQNCGCKIIGHGIESENYCFCCSHCARQSEVNANAKIPQINEC